MCVSSSSCALLVCDGRDNEEEGEYGNHNVERAHVSSKHRPRRPVNGRGRGGGGDGHSLSSKSRGMEVEGGASSHDSVLERCVHTVRLVSF